VATPDIAFHSRFIRRPETGVGIGIDHALNISRSIPTPRPKKIRNTEDSQQEEEEEEE
jgi:hypothetical protein